jgi:hypothetical protein
MVDLTTYILFAGERAWQVCVSTDEDRRFVDLPLPQSVSAADVAELVGAALRTAGYRAGPTMLAIPARWCYAASVRIADFPKHDRNAMAYRLEESLPFAAEDLGADFIASPRRTGSGDESDAALGICCELARLTPILAALESEGIVVQSIVPADVLAAQRLCAAAKNDASILLCAECEPLGAGVNIFGMERGSLARWSRVAGSAQDFKLELDLLSAEFAKEVRIEFLERDGSVSLLADTFPDFATDHGRRTAVAAAETGREVLLGRLSPWIEFRRGPLAAGDRMGRHRRPFNFALASSAVLLLCIASMLMVRAHRYRWLEESNRRQMAQAFSRQYPGWTVPTNVKVIIESEHRKANALASGALPPEARRTALRTLLDVLGHLPDGGRFTMDKMSFDDGSFELQGEIASFEQLDTVASAIRHSGLEVPAPEARRTPAGNWSFVMRGSYRTIISGGAALQPGTN